MGLEEGGVGVVGFGEIDGEAELGEAVGGGLFAQVADVVKEGFGGTAAEVIHLADAEIEEVADGGNLQAGDAIDRRLQGLIIDLFLFTARGCGVGEGEFHGLGGCGGRVRAASKFTADGIQDHAGLVLIAEEADADTQLGRFFAGGGGLDGDFTVLSGSVDEFAAHFIGGGFDPVKGEILHGSKDGLIDIPDLFGELCLQFATDVGDTTGGPAGGDDSHTAAKGGGQEGESEDGQRQAKRNFHRGKRDTGAGEMASKRVKKPRAG